MRKRDIMRDLLSSLRGLNCKDPWCNYRIVTKRPRGNTKDRYRAITLHKERSLIFPLSANLSGYGNVGISMRLRFMVPLLPWGGRIGTPRSRIHCESEYLSVLLSALFPPSHRVFLLLSLFRHLISLLRTSEFLEWSEDRESGAREIAQGYPDEREWLAINKAFWKV